MVALQCLLSGGWVRVLGLVSSELGPRGVCCRSQEGIGRKVSLRPLVELSPLSTERLSALAFWMKAVTILKVIYGC